MLQSRLFAKTRKEELTGEMSAGTRLLLRAGFIDQTAAGIYAMLPLGLLVLQKIERIIADKMDEAGAQRILLPALVPKKLGSQRTLEQLGCFIQGGKPPANGIRAGSDP